MTSSSKKRVPRRRSRARQIFNEVARGTILGAILVNVLAEGGVWYNDKHLVQGGTPLSAGETQMVRDIFGDAVNTDIVRKHVGRPCPDLNGKKTAACVMHGSDRHIFFDAEYTHANDYASADRLPRNVFLHEMTHIWQYQNHLTLYEHYWKSCPTYDYDLSGDVEFDDFCVEQQASIIADYSNFVLRPAFWPPGRYKGASLQLQVMSSALIRVVEDKFPEARNTRKRLEAEDDSNELKSNEIYHFKPNV
ncbi:MAG: hypothetical protein H6867_07055 [Rhodospirillales bacterium]|nr:hypothetical protein [Rhodospirillales bacterium]MCB9995308.1 hypothetical protein [Rhodospirillales bacterium]